MSSDYRITSKREQETSSESNSDIDALPPCKRQRFSGQWEEALHDVDNRRVLGLSDLFGRAHSIDNSTSSGSYGNTSDTEDDFFTLRLEHREGGVASRYQGEERILVFRSDRAGAIAKIIYSSTPAPFFDAGDTVSPVNKENEEEEFSKMAQAKIHVLDVKPQYRGYDLGGLLFSEALASLRHRYMDRSFDDENDKEVNEGSQYHPSSVRCELDAEEDVRRHNKLVNFYQNLGCSVKPNAKVLYLNNNDGETYRKVPMQIALRAQPQEEHKNSQDAGTLVGKPIGFLPVQLLESPGKPVAFPDLGRIDWLMIEDGLGRVELRTTKGHYLRIKRDGSVVICPEDGKEDGETETNNGCKFYLLRVSDATQKVNESLDDESVSDEARRKQLWMLQNVQGRYLGLDKHSHMLSSSKSPTFWQADRHGFSLTCTSDTPPRRQHYRKQWTKQTVEYVQNMHRRYLSFDKKTMSLRHALNLCKALPAHHFAVGVDANAPTLRTRCFLTAEMARNAGHPDWVQLLALVYNLGSVMNLIDTSTAEESADYDWTIPSRSRVVGCTAPSAAIFGEFRSLNSDEKDPRYSSIQGMYDFHCGLENVLLTWSGPEYMYFMLQHNQVEVPEDGLRILRLASLFDWHSNHAYAHLANESDQELLYFVAEFDELLREAKEESQRASEFSIEHCDHLWETHYQEIALKYHAGGALQW